MHNNNFKRLTVTLRTLISCAVTALGGISFGPLAVAAAIDANLVTPTAPLTVSQDVPPVCISASGGLSLSNILVRFSEFIDPLGSQDPFNYTVPGFEVIAAHLNSDQTSVTLSLDGPLNTPGAYTVVVQGMTDLGGNFNPTPCTVSFRAPIYSCGFLVFQVFSPESTTDNALDTTLLADPSFPTDPKETHYLSAFDTRLAYPDDSHEGYGGLIYGLFIPPTSGNWIFYLRSDDSSRLFLNPSGSAAGGKVLLTQETACCERFSAHASAPQALVAGQQYYIEAIYKEGTGGDFCQVAAKLDTDPANPDTLQPISGAYLAAPADPTSTSLSITQQPLDKVGIVGGSYFEDFNTGDGGYAVQTPAAFEGAWAYDSASGAWHEDGQESDDAHPNTSFLTSPTLTVSASGPVTLTFVHRYSFEFDGTRWDGGQLRISVNGGPFTAVPDAAFTQNGYGGNTVAGNSQSELHGQPAFTADSPGYASGYITSIANLGNFNAGDTVRIQFMAASDTNTRGKVPNWQIDSVAATGLQGSQLVTFSTAISTSGNGPVFYQWYRDSGSGFVPIQGANSASYSLLPACSDSGARFRVQVYVPGALMTSQPATVTVTAPNTPPLFVLTPPPAVNEDSGAQAVAGTAHDILAGTGSVSVSTPSIGLNFGADEVAGTSTGTLSPGVKAGVVQQVNWNNLTGASGNASGVVADYSGTPIGTVVSVTWSSPNTWSSTGRGEENNGFPAGGDRTLMTGYLDTTDQAAGGASVTVSGIGSEFTGGGYDVIVYALGGVAGRGGAYTIGSTTKYGTSPASPAAQAEDVGLDLTDTGTFMRFTSLTGSSFTLTANADATVNPAGTVNFRAPINGIQIVAHQPQPNPAVSFASTFDSLPAGTLSSGTTPPFVDSGHLDLTRSGVTSEANYWTIPFTASTFRSFKAQWKTLLNGAGGADGISFNVGKDLGTGFTPEEGAGNGLSVTVDTFDNGALPSNNNTPAEVGIEARWNGARLSFVPIGSGTVNGPSELEKNQFVDSSVEVTSSGLMTFHYDSYAVAAQIPGYAGINANMAVFAGRTGGASEDGWIDDLTFAGFVPEACGDESAQTVHFIVSNDNPGLFGAQPAIDAQGTLTYTPAANQSGLAHVTVVAMDTGGTAFGGQDTSAPQTFDIQVNAVGDCPTNAPLSVTVAPGGQVSFQLVAGDPDGGPLTYAITQPPAHGIVVLQVQTGAASYSPNSGYCGPDSFAFTVNDGQCTSSAATVSITVSCATNRCPTANALSVSVAQGGQVNFQLPASDSDGDPLQYNITQPPAHGIVVLQVQTGATSYSPTAGYCGPDSFKYSVTDRQCAAVEATVSVTVNCTNNSPPNCIARISPAACGVAFPGNPNVSVVSLNGTDGCVILDGSGTTDAENDPLHFTWKEGTNTLGTAAVVTNCFSLGCHVLTLTVTDGQSTCTATLIVCVISPCEAVEKCIALVDNSTVVRKNKRPILASLKAACASFDQGDLVPGINQLQACQNKIRAQISRDNPTEGQAFIKCIEQILDAIDCMTQLGHN